MPALFGCHLLEAFADLLALLRRQASPALLVFKYPLPLLGGQRLELPEAIHDLITAFRGKLPETLVGVLKLAAPSFG